MFVEWKRIARESGVICHALTCITNEDGIFVCPSRIFLSQGRTGVLVPMLTKRDVRDVDGNHELIANRRHFLVLAYSGSGPSHWQTIAKGKNQPLGCIARPHNQIPATEIRSLRDAHPR